MSQVKQYRKKPVVIEAKQYLGTEASLKEIKDWAYGWGGKISGGNLLNAEHTLTLDINTLEGVMVAVPGDWVIKGIQNEFYPCKPDIFEATYEPI